MKDSDLMCTRCGAVIPRRDGVRFCRFCGGSLKTRDAGGEERRCASCGGRLNPADRFCTSCRAPVSSAHQSSAEAAHGVAKTSPDPAAGPRQPAGGALGYGHEQSQERGHGPAGLHSPQASAEGAPVASQPLPHLPTPQPHSPAQHPPPSRGQSRPGLTAFLVLGSLAALAVLLVGGAGVGWWLLSDRSTLLLEEHLEPSPEDRAFPVDERLSVTVPGGLLDEPTTLRVTRSPRGPKLADGILSAGSGKFDITLDGLEEAHLDPPVRLEFSYDQEANAGHEDLLLIAYDDPVIGDWIVMDSNVDRERGVVWHDAAHLSVWALLEGAQFPGLRVGSRSVHPLEVEKVEGLPHSDQPRFRVYYLARHKAEVDDSRVATGDLALEIARGIESAYRAYHEAGFSVPVFGEDERRAVVLDPSQDKDAGVYRTARGLVLVSTRYSSIASARATAAHELFHAVQVNDLGWLALWAMHANLWLTEGTAEYAGWRVAGNGDIDPLYKLGIRQPWNYADDAHEYAIAWFIHHLAEVEGIGFHTLWEALVAASQDNRPLSPRTMDLAAYWHSGTTGREHYRAFLHRLITEQLSEEEDVLYGRTDIPRLRDDWLPSEDGGHLYVDVHMTVSKATSMAAAAVIPPEGREGGPRDVIIEIEGIEEHAELAAFVLPTVSLYGDTRLSEGARLVLDEKRGEYRPSMRMSPPRVTLEEDESLLLTLFGHEDDVTGQVRVRTMAPPLRVELAPGPQRPGLPVREDPTREAPMFTGVEPEGEHVLRARLGPLDEETEKVEIHWSAPCDPHRGSPITAEISEDERIEGVAMEWPCKIAPRPGYHEIEVRLVEVPALGRRRQIAKEARGLYVAVISEAFGASRHVEVGGRRLPAVGAEVRISAEPRSGDYRYRWSMGDGSTRITSEPRVTHTYEKAGSYRIGLELLSSQEGQAEVLGSARPRVIVIGEERRRPSREREPPVAASDPEPSRRDELREMVTRHPNGNIRERYTYFEGEGAGPGRIVRHGEHETFAEDGTRTLLGRYERGQLEGRFQRWWANGNKRMEAHYVGGSRHGQYREWHMNGKPSVEGRYVDGQRDGVWTHFDQGGSKTGQVTWREGARAR